MDVPYRGVSPVLLTLSLLNATHSDGYRSAMADIMVYRQALGANIRKLRKGRKVSQERLAEIIGASRVHVGYVEQGKRTPSLDLLLDIAEALDVPMRDLFDFTWTADGADGAVEYESRRS